MVPQTFLGHRHAWFHKLMPSASCPTLYIAFFRITVCTTNRDNKIQNGKAIAVTGLEGP
jgi:hypothetical protein